MRDYNTLKVLDKISFVFKKFGVNYELMRTILKMKLTLDSRRVPTVLATNNNTNKDKNMFFSSLWLYVLFGLFMMIIVIMDISLYAKMSLNIGMNMFLLMTTMISDFSSVLLNVKDKNIMMTKPIDAKTYNAAKLVHILIYLFSIAISLNLLSMIAGTVKHGVLFLMIYIIELILICSFILFLTSLTYHFVLKFFDGERLKDMINSFQIILSIVIVVGYQVLVRSMSFINLDITINIKWWTYLIPPFWFAAPYDLLLAGNRNMPFIILGLIGVLIPVVSLWLHFKVIAPRFERNLLKLNQGGAKKNANKRHKKALRKKKIYRLVSGSKLENTFIRFTENMLKRERKLKLKIYPNLALATILPFIMLFAEFTSTRTFNESLASVRNSNSYFTLYASILLLSALFVMMVYSESYKGAWIYKTLPLKEPGIIMKGAFKGFILKYYIKIFLLLSILFAWIYGNRIIIDLVIIFLNLILVTLVAFQFSDKYLPFSQTVDDVTKNNTAVFFLILMVLAPIGIVHYLVHNHIWMQLGYGVVIILIIFIMYHVVMKIKWEDL